MSQNIYPVFQPIYNLATSRVFFYEALLRLQNADADMPTNRFIQLAEQSGFVHHLDLEMIGQVFSNLLLHQDAHIAVNVSMKTLETSAHDIFMLLARHHDIAHRLIFEITETATTGDLARVLSCVNAFRAFGCRIALDDYGEGFCTDSLTHLVQPSFVKISGRRFNNAFDKESYAPLLHAQELIQDMDCSLIVEHVDTQAKLVELKSLGVRYVQGYLLCRPQETLVRCPQFIPALRSADVTRLSDINRATV